MHIISLILLPVNAPMVNCQDELSLHLLQEEAQAPRGSLSRIMLLPFPAEPILRPWAVGLHAMLGSLAQADASKLPVVLELCFSPAVRAAHKYGSLESWNEGLCSFSHHPHIIRRTTCLWVSTHLICGLHPEMTISVINAPVILHSEMQD